jgi:hypothetical protein
MNAPQQHDRGDMAEMLAAAIGQHFGVDFGAPGPANDPAANAMTWITKVAKPRAALTRYDCATQGGVDDPIGTMEPCADGEYVRFDDVAPLLAAPAASVPADRDALIEQCAQIVEDTDKKEYKFGGAAYDDVPATLSAAADAIRALKGKPAAPTALSDEAIKAAFRLHVGAFIDEEEESKRVIKFVRSLVVPAAPTEPDAPAASGWKYERFDMEGITAVKYPDGRIVMVSARKIDCRKIRKLFSDMLAALTAPAAPLTVPQGWQPMDTAPKNGDEVLLMVKRRAGIEHCQLVGHYMEGGHCIEDHPPIAAGWYFWNGCMFDKAAEPLWWMPLPAVPGSGMTKGGAA